MQGKNINGGAFEMPRNESKPEVCLSLLSPVALEYQ